MLAAVTFLSDIFAFLKFPLQYFHVQQKIPACYALVLSPQKLVCDEEVFCVNEIHDISCMLQKLSRYQLPIYLKNSLHELENLTAKVQISASTYIF